MCYNLVKKEDYENRPLDVIAEYDTQETIDALRLALESGGHSVVLVEADDNAFENFKKIKDKIDIVFNVAESRGNENREAHIPMILDMLNIPYTGSNPWTLISCLNKAKAKQILDYNNISTPRFQVIDSINFKLSKRLKFPLIIKLLHEGSQIGMNYDSVVYNIDSLKKEVTRLTSIYSEPVIVEEYLDGREFTVPLIGNFNKKNKPIVLPIIEVVYDNVPEGKPKINVFVPDDPVLNNVDKQKLEKENVQLILNHSSVCPAEISKEKEDKIRRLSLAAFKALECKDWCRLEIREDKNGKLHVIELNPIAGIAPDYFFPKSAKVYGLSYNELICKILDFALERYRK